LAVAAQACQQIGRLCLGTATQTMQQLPAAFDVEASRERLFNEMLAAQDKGASELRSSGDPAAAERSGSRRPLVFPGSLLLRWTAKSEIPSV